LVSVAPQPPGPMDEVFCALFFKKALLAFLNFIMGVRDGGAILV
jgi:hypothetical protein